MARGARAPREVLGAERTCRLFRGALRAPEVLRELPAAGVSVSPRAFASGGGELFLERVAAAGNPHAQYLLGMVRFYCQAQYTAGRELLYAAGNAGHTEALYALAVIEFNGSSGARTDKCIKSAVLLCIAACERGHQRALQELGLCMSRGYGMPRDREVGRRMLLLANKNDADFAEQYGCIRAPPPGNEFLTMWWKTHSQPDHRRLCSNPQCGRLETRKHEFRRCTICNAAYYCSFSCQTVHWKNGHSQECEGDVSSPDVSSPDAPEEHLAMLQQAASLLPQGEDEGSGGDAVDAGGAGGAGEGGGGAQPDIEPEGGGGVA